MSYLPNMSFKGALDASVFYNSVNYKIPDDFVSVSFSIVLNGSGVLRLFSSNDNVSYKQFAARIIDTAPFQFEVFQLSGLYFKWAYENSLTPETNLQIAVRVSTNDINTIISGDLEMNGHNIVDAGTISCETLQYTTLNPPLPPSSWVGFATSDLNMNNNSITNASNVSLYGTLNTNTLLAPSGLLSINSVVQTNDLKVNIISVKNSGLININNEIDVSGNITCDTLNYTTLNPVPPSSWVDTATSNLNMATYSINNATDINANNNILASGNILTIGPDSGFSCLSSVATNSFPIIQTSTLQAFTAGGGNIHLGATLDAQSNNLINVSNINGNPVQYLTEGQGINISNSLISTIGNPDIGLTTLSYYVNDGEKDLQTALTEASGLQDVNIYMSGGSFGGNDITISGQTNQNIIAPNNVGTICELGSSGTPRNVTITNSTRVCINNLQINGNLILSGTGGSHKFLRCNFKSGVVTLTGLTGGFVVFENCEWTNSQVVHLAGFAGVVYYINCNFGNATWTCDQSLATQVILTNSSGLTSFTLPAKRTLAGLCSLTNGTININTNNLNTTTINGSAYPPTGSTFDPTAQVPVKYGSSGVGASAGARSVSIGDGSGANSIFPNAQDSIAIGTGSNARANDTIALGRFALVGGSDGIAIGKEAYSSGLSIAIGNDACINTGSSSTGVFIGNQVGSGAGGLIQDSTIIGHQAGYNTQSIQESVIIGNSAWTATNCLDVIAVGRNCGQNSTGSKVISIGNNSSLDIASQNLVIGNGCFNGTGGFTRGCIILGHDICNSSGVSNNSLIINNSNSAFDPQSVENAVYIKNMRNTNLDYNSYAHASNAITYNDQTNELSKQRVYINQGQLDGGSPATLSFYDNMFDDASKVVVLFSKQTFNHNNSKLSFVIGGGSITFTGNSGDNDFIGVQAYRITL